MLARFEERDYTGVALTLVPAMGLWRHVNALSLQEGIKREHRHEHSFVRQTDVIFLAYKSS